MSTYRTPTIPLPRGWNQHVKSAVLHVTSLAQHAMASACGQATDSINPRMRQQAEVDRLKQELALVNEQLRIITARMKSIPARKRPRYESVERMAILELKAARGWSLQQTADAFLVTPATIASWGGRADDENDSLVRLREPVNKFPDFVRYAVQRLKTLCPTMGKAKIAETLSRAGLTLNILLSFAQFEREIIGDRPNLSGNPGTHGRGARPGNCRTARGITPTARPNPGFNSGGAEHRQPERVHGGRIEATQRRVEFVGPIPCSTRAPARRQGFNRTRQRDQRSPFTE